MADIDFEKLEEALGDEGSNNGATSPAARRSPPRRKRYASPQFRRSPERRRPSVDRRRLSPQPERRRQWRNRSPSPIRRRFESPLQERTLSSQQLNADPLLKKAKDAQKAERDDLTVLIRNVNPRATERDIWQFISGTAGKVRDIQIIRDSRSGRNKGVAYVELYTQAGVLSAITLSGAELMGMRVTITPSQAEKNRAARAAKGSSDGLLPNAPCRIVVAGLTGELMSLIEQGDLRELFMPFGAVKNVEMARDAYTGQFRGFAYLSFRNASEAAEAVAAMHGFQLGEETLRVGYEAPLPTSC